MVGFSHGQRSVLVSWLVSSAVYARLRADARASGEAITHGDGSSVVRAPSSSADLNDTPRSNVLAKVGPKRAIRTQADAEERIRSAHRLPGGDRS